MSTDSGARADNGRPKDVCYLVSPHVRVRKEEFGLLFYDTKNPGLAFVKSGDHLRISNLPQGGKMIAVNVETAVQKRVRKLLDYMLQRGLVIEA